MSLDALAPDQRAVVQLVLQQERSYEDLAGLLGITADAVRDRAHKGLDRLAPTAGVADADRAAVADYLLGQQSVSGRESTRTLLSGSTTARAWAQAVRAELADVARSPLPDVPAEESAAAAEPPAADEDDDLAGPFVPDQPAADPPVIADPLTRDEPSPTRARPRPRRAAPDYGFDEPAPTRAEEDAAEAPLDAESANRTSRLGGALLIAGLAIFVAALIVWLVTRSDNNTNKGNTTATTGSTPAATASPTAAATPDYQPFGVLALRSPSGGPAQGRFVLFVAQNTQQIAFNIKGTNVAPSQAGQAYGVWLVGGAKNHFLGFTPPVGKNGSLAVSGPRASDAANFARWFASSKQLVVSTETQDGGSAPSQPIILSGDVKKLVTAANLTPTPTP